MSWSQPGYANHQQQYPSPYIPQQNGSLPLQTANLSQQNGSLSQQNASLPQLPPYHGLYMPQHLQIPPPPQQYPPPTQQFRNLTREECTLSIRQEPLEALVTLEGREKSRKPIDPPPFLQLKLDPHSDSVNIFFNSPNLFCTVHLVGEHDENTVRTKEGKPALIGTLASSIHRLKDSDNQGGPGAKSTLDFDKIPYGGFFVFGDISVRAEAGVYRLKFGLFDLQRRQHGAGVAVYLAEIVSSPFKVLNSKEFRGLNESTYLSRAFSDQGVRLRLRKEPRTFGAKRSRSHDDDELQRNEEPRIGESSFMAQNNSNKRTRYDPGLNGTLEHGSSAEEAFGSQGGAVRPPTSAQGYATPTANYYTHGDVQQNAGAGYNERYEEEYEYPNPTLGSSSSPYGGLNSTTNGQDPSFYNTSASMYLPQRYPTLPNTLTAPTSNGLANYHHFPSHHEQDLAHEQRNVAALPLPQLPVQPNLASNGHHQAEYAPGAHEYESGHATPAMVLPRPKSRYEESVELAAEQLRNGGSSGTLGAEQELSLDPF